MEDSDITADADTAFGGRVIIDAQAIFRAEDSDITATSELGTQFSGTVEINTPDVDPSRGLVALPVELVDVSGLVAQGCPAGGGVVGRGTSEFIITGRGGLPPQPGETLRTPAVATSRYTLEAGLENHTAEVNSTPLTRSTPAPLVEAQGWVVNAQGQVVLTASTFTPHNPWMIPPQCHAS